MPYMEHMGIDLPHGARAHKEKQIMLVIQIEVEAKYTSTYFGVEHMWSHLVIYNCQTNTRIDN